MKKIYLIMALVCMMMVSCKPDGGENGGDNNDNNLIDGHEYVDLGLPSGIKWATCNVGAKSPEEYGHRFAWGETSPKNEYTKENSLLYNKKIKDDISGNAEYDAATFNWGDKWRMPTKDELKELREFCLYQWTFKNGSIGMSFTGPNGNSIFFPVHTPVWDNDDYMCICWSSTPGDYTYDYDEENQIYYIDGWAYLLCTDEDKDVYIYDVSFYHGFPIRPVSGGVRYACVTTDEVTEITARSVVCGGNVTTDNGTSVTSRGVCWSTKPHPTIENKTIDGSGIGQYKSYITDLKPSTTYYVRAYATNAAGTIYGEEFVFTTLLEISGEENGYEYVDLGLPSGLKWATYNVGATSPEEYGDYFIWSKTTMGEYSEDDPFDIGIEDIAGNPKYDAATANWGDNWRLPTPAEQKELVDNCTWTWVTQNGVNGYNVRGQNDNCIFLPAAGCAAYGVSVGGDGSHGFYLSSVCSDRFPSDLDFTSEYIFADDWGIFYARSVRPVIE